MRKIALLLAVVGLAGCAGNGNDRFDLSTPRPVAGTYTGDGSILASGSNQPVTAPIQSAEVDNQFQTHLVVGPFGGQGGDTYTISGTFLPDQRFNGTISTNGGADVPVTGSYIASNSEFKLSIPNFPNGNQNFSVLAQLNNPQ